MAESPVRAGPTLLTTANTTQTIYTAGAVSTWAILREVTIINETTGLVKVTYGIGTTNTDAAGKRLLPVTFTLDPGGAPYTWGGFIPLIGGSTPDLLYAMCDTANGATITLGLVTGP
jgi:hypothetical protein